MVETLAPVDVLLIEDNEHDYFAIDTFLRSLRENNQITLEWVPDYERALQEMAQNRFDVYLVDYMLGAEDGIDLLRQAKQLGFDRPFILLTGHGDHALDVTALECGAADFIVKDQLDVERLERSIRYAYEQWRIRKSLETSLHEKDVLLREIHHRVKNNLQIISSLLRMQARLLSENEAREVLQRSCDRVRSMALIHDKLYRSKNFAAINIKDYVLALGQELLQLYALDPKRIVFSVHGDETMLPLDTAIPCALILHETLSNAFQHAFTQDQSGIVRVTFEQRGPSIVVRIEDNGIGLPKEINLDNPRSLGLDLVTTFAAQISASMEVEREHGTRFTFQFVIEKRR